MHSSRVREKGLRIHALKTLYYHIGLFQIWKLIFESAVNKERSLIIRRLDLKGSCFQLVLRLGEVSRQFTAKGAGYEIKTPDDEPDRWFLFTQS